MNCEEKVDNTIINDVAIEQLMIIIFKIIEMTKKKKEKDVNDINPLQLGFKNRKTSKESYGICPYIKTIGFAWSPKGNLLFFKLAKIDAKNLKNQEKIINNSNNLQEWVSLCMTGVSTHQKTNLFISSETIMPIKLRKLINYESPLQIEEIKIFDFINNRSLPKKDEEENKANSTKLKQLQKNKKSNENYLDLQNKDLLKGVFKEFNTFAKYSHDTKVKFNNFTEKAIFSNNMQDQIMLMPEESSNFINTIPKTDNNDINERSGSTISLVFLDIFQEKNYILENLEVKVLCKDKFFSIINNFLINMNNNASKNLLEILNTINFFINSILEIFNSPLCSPMIFKHFANNILKILITLEKSKYFSYLYIAVLLITTRLCDNLIDYKLKSKNTNEQNDNNCSLTNLNLFFKDKDNNYPKTLSTLSEAISNERKHSKIPLIRSEIKEENSIIFRSSSFNNEKIIRESIKASKLSKKNSIESKNILQIADRKHSTTTLIETGADMPIAISINLMKENNIQSYFLLKNYNNANAANNTTNQSLSTSQINNSNFMKSFASNNQLSGMKFKINTESQINQNSRKVYLNDVDDDSELGYRAEYKMKAAGNEKFAKSINNSNLNSNDTKQINKKVSNKLGENSHKLSKEPVTENQNASNNIDFNLIHIFPKNIYVTFCDILYFYSTELYRMNRMVERAQIEKFIRILTEGLGINKYISPSNIVNVTNISNLTHHSPSKTKKMYKKKSSFVLDPKEIVPFSIKFPISSRVSIYSNQNLFKTEISNSILKLTCDLCGQLLKLGDFTISSYKYRVQGHYEHVISYIETLSKMSVLPIKNAGSMSFSSQRNNIFNVAIGMKKNNTLKDNRKRK